MSLNLFKAVESVPKKNSASLRLCVLLKFVVEAEADDVVGAGVGLLTEDSLLVVVAVERAEVADVEADLLVDVPGTTEAE